jgi:hypothetical protein
MTPWEETWANAKILSRYMNTDELIFWRVFLTTMNPIFTFLFIALLYKILINKYDLQEDFLC